MEDILVPIFVAALMPVAVVYIVFWSVRNNDDRRADVLIKAIESGNIVDADKLAEALGKPRKSPRELLNGRLLRGCIFSLIGSFLIIIDIVKICCGAEMGDYRVTTLFIFSGISLAIGISYLIVFSYAKRQLEVEANNNVETE